MKRIIFGCLLFAPWVVTAQECRLDDVLDQYTAYVQQDKTMAALTLLEQAYSVCPHPRLLLEQGEMHLEHNDPDKAILAWEKVLDSSDVPNNVAQNIKLRIVQQRLNKPKTSSRQAVLSLNQEWDLQPITGVGFSTVLRQTNEPVGFSGYPMSQGLFVKLSGNARYFWESAALSHASLVSVGWQANAKPLNLAVGPSLRTVNEDVFFTLDASVTLRAEQISVQQQFEFSISDEPHEWQQEFVIGWPGARIKTGLEFEIFESEIYWTDFNTGIQGKGRLRPQLILNYDPEEVSWAPEAGVRWFINRDVFFDIDSGIRLMEEPQWFVESSLSWRPF